MARKIKAKVIMELCDQGMSRRSIAKTRRISMGSVCEVFDIADLIEAVRELCPRPHVSVVAQTPCVRTRLPPDAHGYLLVVNSLAPSSIRVTGPLTHGISRARQRDRILSSVPTERRFPWHASPSESPNFD